jgi:hypothetical protein
MEIAMGEKGNIAAGFDPTTPSQAPRFGFPAAPSGFAEEGVGKGPADAFSKGPADAFGKGPTDDFGKAPEEGFAKGPSASPGAGVAQAADWQKFPGGTNPAVNPGQPVIPAQGAPWNPPPVQPASAPPGTWPAGPPVAGFYRHTEGRDDQPDPPPPPLPPPPGR